MINLGTYFIPSLASANMDFDRTVHPPTLEEKALIDRLLSNDFVGRDALRTQAKSMELAWIVSSAAPALRLHVTGGLRAPSNLQRIPVEGVAEDTDGMPIHFLLHVSEGLMREVEIFREDGERLRRFPPPDSIELLPV